jgi:hypothetical protein
MFSTKSDVSLANMVYRTLSELFYNFGPRVVDSRDRAEAKGRSNRDVINTFTINDFHVLAVSPAFRYHVSKHRKKQPFTISNPHPNIRV